MYILFDAIPFDAAMLPLKRYNDVSWISLKWNQSAGGRSVRESSLPSIINHVHTSTDSGITGSRRCCNTPWIILRWVKSQIQRRAVQKLKQALAQYTAIADKFSIQTATIEKAESRTTASDKLKRLAKLALEVLNEKDEAHRNAIDVKTDHEEVWSLTAWLICDMSWYNLHLNTM